jgi:hypothetical protein
MITWIEKDNVWYGSNGYTHFKIYRGEKSPFIVVTADTITSEISLNAAKRHCREYIQRNGFIRNKKITQKKIQEMISRLPYGRFIFV